MINKKKILCIIPARKGSKGILNKNIKLFNKKPLIYWTIKESLKSKYIDRCIVSTDSEKIKNISIKFGADAPFLRPKKISTDKSDVEEAISYTINKLSEKFDFIILLQPTSPLRTSKEIDRAIRVFEKKNYFNLVSITKNHNPIEWILTKSKKGKIDFLLNKYRYRRQDGKLLYSPTGSIFISKIKYFLRNKTFYTNNTYGFEMDNIKSIDIDSEEDFKLAEIIHKYK